MLDTLSEYQECIFRLACFILYVYFPLFWIFFIRAGYLFFFFRSGNIDFEVGNVNTVLQNCCFLHLTWGFVCAR